MTQLPKPPIIEGGRNEILSCLRRCRGKVHFRDIVNDTRVLAPICAAELQQLATDGLVEIMSKGYYRATAKARK